jgi:hypothetical protein
MNHPTTLTLRVLVPDAPSYAIGDEIWQVGLADAIAEEADTIVTLAGAQLLEEPTDACRNAGERYRGDPIVSAGEMARALSVEAAA